MCLNIPKKLKPAPKQVQIVYKVLQLQKRHGKYIASPKLLFSCVYSFTWKVKIGREYTSGRVINKVCLHEKLNEAVTMGFHVYTKFSEAVMNYNSYHNFIVAFKAYPEDFIAYGKNNSVTAGAVYTKLTLHKVYRDHEIKKLCA